MSSHTAEQTIADPASDLAVSAGPAALAGGGELAGRGDLAGGRDLTASQGPPEMAVVHPGRLGRLRADAERMAAVRDVWRALWTSRLLVWIAGAGVVATLGSGPVRHAFNPLGLTRGLGRLGEVLAAPAARWDAAWYLVIAHYGYRPDLGSFTASRTAFFPLYPLLLHVLADLGPTLVIAGVLVSLMALTAGLYGLHRLTTLEATRLAQNPLALGGGAGAAVQGPFPRRTPAAGEVARLAVLLTAFAPMAFYFSAIYSESLYFALSVGVFLCARRGRWAVAAGLAGLAATTRSAGVVLVVPLLLLYLYGPRDDRVPDHVPAYLRHQHAWRVPVASLLRTLRPRYRVRRDALWLALVPAGLGLYMAHLALAGGDPLAPFHAEAVWQRHFAGPYGGAWDGAKAAFEGLRQLLSFQRHHVYYPAAGGSPFINAAHNLLLFAFLLAAVPALVGVLRRLPLAYGVYVLAALALPLSYPVTPQPLMSLPRFLLVLFPFNIWLALRLHSRSRALTRGVLAASAVALAFFVGEFATWHWVA